MVQGYWEGIFSAKVILPAFIESLGIIAVMTRQMRAGIIEVLSADYIRTARAKGLRERVVILRHAMRNALIPIATILGLMLGGLVAGSFLVENWFGIPGVGQLAFDALLSRDYYITMALVLLIAVAYVLSNLLVDVLYGVLDPRIRKA
jgi:ABC-type dipeptide/oligopeptide/nickel transport system permease component